MKFLLFFLGISFFFIFFFFSEISLRESFFENLFLEAHLYIFLSLLCVLSLIPLPSRRWKKGEEKEKLLAKITFTRADIAHASSVFFEKYIYYIGTLLFYLSLFLILKALLWEIDIPFVFLCFNILVVALYYFQNKFPLFQDFIRINTLVVSLYYVSQSLQYLFWLWGSIGLIGVINILFVFLLFYYFIISSKGKNYLPVISSYALIFTFLQIVTLYTHYFSDSLLGISFLSFFLGLSCLFLTQKIASVVSVRKGLVRIWGLIFLYISSIFTPLYILKEDVLAGIFILFSGVTAYFLFKFHERFQNYISLFFASYSGILVALWIYNFTLPQSAESYYLFLFCFFLSGVFLLWDRLSKIHYIYDKYFFRSFSIVVNLVWVICFLYFIEVSILKLAFLLFGECLYFFYSYYSLRNENSLWYTSVQKTQK